MKKILLLTLLISVSHIAFAQTVIKDDTVKLGRVVSTLPTATGWVKQLNGKWLSAPNKIPFYEPDYNNEYYNKLEIGTENFKSIRISEIKVLERDFYLLLITYKKGSYYNEKKDSGWYSYTRGDYYVIEKKDWNRAWNDTMKFGQKYGANFQIRYAGWFNAGNVSKIPKKLVDHIKWNITYDHPKDSSVSAYYQFALWPVKDKRGSFLRFNTSLGYAAEELPPPAVDYGLFQTQYWELPLSSWKLFVKAR